MVRFPRMSPMLSTIILLSFIGTSTAFAQQPSPSNQTPISNVDVAAPRQTAAAAPTTATPTTVAPAPSVVIGLAGIPDGPAQVLPPAPKIVARSARLIVIPSGGLSPGAKFTTQRAAWSDLKVNSSFGYRRDPFSRRGRMHTGVDLKAAYGETVGAALAGTVSFAGVKRGYGNIVMIEHGNGVSTYYAHLSSIAVQVGQTITSGQVIGQIGSTGRSTSPHLHFEVRANGQPVNPLATIAVDGTQVFVDGRPLSGTAVEGWGDEPVTAVGAAPSDGASGALTRARRIAKQPAGDKRPIVFGKDSLTEY